MIRYLEKVRQEVQQLTSFEIQHIPRSENSKADALSKFASSASCDTLRHVFWEVKQTRSIDVLTTTILDPMATWMDDIVNFKMNGVLPEDPKQAERLQKKCTWFEIRNGTLYKKAFSQPLLRCITPEKGQEVLEDLHHGLCSSHIGGRALAEKALRIGYYWPTLKKDALDLVKRCDKCQRFAHLIRRPAQKLTPITSPIQFAKWGMDILGPYTTAPGELRYVIVVVDYFTKWFIVFDNGPQFKTLKLESWLADHGVTACFASVSRPQANGQVDAFNKIISEGMKKKLDEAKGLWADELPNVLWSIRTTAGLDFLPETRGNAALRQQLYKLRMTREYNQRVSRRILKVGDFVLRKMEAVGRANEQGKLTPTWEGPYEIYEEVRDGTYRIQDMQGRLSLRTWNADNLKNFFF
ncbi:uncharacterized protein [Spinacia oleracea]|uniref:Integrase catalytic domain-containing protein n=1 Tax=Spinacia oleracea TaxID=3562 RepID=A0ABM3R056_SPIOL|nr:uncharacterized protein LOC130463791 [Spinacia oleracea]